MSLAWSTFEAALRTWIKTGSSLTDEYVRFADQKVAKPTSGSFITVRVGDLIHTAGVDERRRTASVTVGAEVVHTVTGLREVVVSLQAFSAATVGSDSARALLGRVQAALGLDSVRFAFHAAGCSCFDSGTVKSLSVAVPGNQTVFEGRAVLEARFYVVETVAETSTYIETVERPKDYTGPPLGTVDNIDF